MIKTVVAVILTTLFFGPFPFDGKGLGLAQQLVAVEGLPFSALIYFEDDGGSRYDIRLMMAPEQVTEKNIRLLAKVLSKKYPPPKPLAVHVATDLEAPSAVASRTIIVGDPGEGDSNTQVKENQGTEIRQWVFYTRRGDVELFRYNPNFPKSNGMKTIILRGKE